MTHPEVISTLHTRNGQNSTARQRASMVRLAAVLGALSAVACGGAEDGRSNPGAIGAAGTGRSSDSSGTAGAAGASGVAGGAGAGVAGGAGATTDPTPLPLDAPVSAAGPGVRFGATAAYLGDTGRMMLFGGCASPVSCTPLSGTWTREGGSWTVEEFSGPPSARFYHAMTYDPGRSEVVLFGGNSDPMGASVYVTSVHAGLDETWTYDGWTWIKKTLAHSPSGRAGSKMVYDAEHEVVVLFGGAGDGNYLSDTWLWDGMDWSNPHPATSPTARAHHTMAYDSVRKKVVLFGGYNEQSAGMPTGDGALGDTWLWDGVTWTEASPATAPTPRTSASMAFDGESAVLFGGWQGGSSLTPFAETWAWDGTTWAQRTPSNAPSARYLNTLAYDPSRSVVTLFGGLNEQPATNGPTPPTPSSGVSSDTWEWDRSTWTEQ